MFLEVCIKTGYKDIVLSSGIVDPTEFLKGTETILHSSYRETLATKIHETYAGDHRLMLFFKNIHPDDLSKNITDYVYVNVCLHVGDRFTIFPDAKFSSAIKITADDYEVPLVTFRNMILSDLTNQVVEQYGKNNRHYMGLIEKAQRASLREFLDTYLINIQSNSSVTTTVVYEGAKGQTLAVQTMEQYNNGEKPDTGRFKVARKYVRRVVMTEEFYDIKD